MPIEAGEDMLDQGVVAAPLFADRVAQPHCTVSDGHAPAGAVLLGLGAGTELRVGPVDSSALGRVVDQNVQVKRRQSIFLHRGGAFLPVKGEGCCRDNRATRAPCESVSSQKHDPYAAHGSV